MLFSLVDLDMSNSMMLKLLKKHMKLLIVAISMEELSDLMLLPKGIDQQEAIDLVDRVASEEVRVALVVQETQEIQQSC